MTDRGPMEADCVHGVAGYDCKQCPQGPTEETRMTDDNQYQIRHPLAEPVFVALGAASTCWIGGTGDAVFDSARAVQLGEELLCTIIKRETTIAEAAAQAMTAASMWQDLAVRAESILRESALLSPGFAASPSSAASWRRDYLAALEQPTPQPLDGGG